MANATKKLPRRYLHLADLHLGKRLGGFPLLEEQEDVLEQAIALVQARALDGVLIAGDIYDRPSPPVEAMALFDRFLTQLHRLGVPAALISGNHDAPGRISYFSDLLAPSGIRVPGEFAGVLECVSSPDDPVQIWLLPFVTPGRVRRFYPETPVTTYEEAVRAVLAHSPIDKERINLLLAHQFITGGATCDSEELAVGGLDQVDAAVFADFDYVALGHLHQPQRCTRDTVRYAGSPLKYSLSEENQRKSFTLVTVHAKDDITVEEVPVRFLRDVYTVKGPFAELREAPLTEDYVRVLLTDEEAQPDARMLLRSNFPRMVRFGVENSRVRTDLIVVPEEAEPERSPLAMFEDFFIHQNNGTPPTEEQLALAQEIFRELEEEARA